MICYDRTHHYLKTKEVTLTKKRRWNGRDRGKPRTQNETSNKMNFN